MAAGGLKAVRELLFVCYVKGIIDDEEFLILLGIDNSCDIFLYWNFEKLNFGDWG